jgi:hypothetical protein
MSSVIGAAADMGRGATKEAKEWVAGLLHREPGFTLASPILAPYFARDPDRRRQMIDRLREAGIPEA